MIYHLPPRKLAEADLDAQIDARRAEYDAACEAEAMGLGIPAPIKVLYTDTSLPASIRRSMQEWWRSLLFRARLWLACRGKPPC